MMLAASIVLLVFAALPALLYARNIRLFRPPPLPTDDSQVPAISVLIPARNEEASIREAVESVLQSTDVRLEVIVLDDHSTDRTASIVEELRSRDLRVRLESAEMLPAGWCGKQFACFQLARLASHDTFTFLDADVRLEPTALARMIAFQRTSGAALVSGFPRQQTGTMLEKLVIPLMHWLLLGFLPFDRMRVDLRPGLGAGCGQWFLTTRTAYEQSGGHAAIRDSLHDGVKLPRAYRRAGLKTDLCDVTDLARCRMYASATQVWNGLAKNAHEGLGAPKLLPFMTVLLGGGHILPWLLTPVALTADPIAAVVLGTACAVSILPRLNAALRYRQSWLGAALHPLGVMCLLMIQWYALARRLIGKPVGWKGRPVPATS